MSYVNAMNTPLSPYDIEWGSDSVSGLSDDNNKKNHSPSPCELVSDNVGILIGLYCLFLSILLLFGHNDGPDVPVNAAGNLQCTIET